MIDPRTKDALRQLPNLVKAIEAQTLEITKLQEGQTYMKEQIRAIKKSVTRKYDKTSLLEKVTGKK